MLQKLTDKFVSNPRMIFVIDGVGAFTSVIMLGVVLIIFNDMIGMPPAFLAALACTAFFMAIYDLSTYHVATRFWRGFLRVIATANVLYSLASIALIIYFFNQLTNLGLIYFVLEVSIILILAMMQFRLAAIIKH